MFKKILLVLCAIIMIVVPVCSASKLTNQLQQQDFALTEQNKAQLKIAALEKKLDDQQKEYDKLNYKYKDVCSTRGYLLMVIAAESVLLFFSRSCSSKDSIDYHRPSAPSHKKKPASMKHCVKAPHIYQNEYINKDPWAPHKEDFKINSFESWRKYSKDRPMTEKQKRYIALIEDYSGDKFHGESMFSAQQFIETHQWMLRDAS